MCIRDSNPAMINAVTEFFGEVLGDPDSLNGPNIPDLPDSPASPTVGGVPPLVPPELLAFMPDSFDDTPDLVEIFAELMRIFSPGVPYEHGEMPAHIALQVRNLTELPFPNTVADLLLDARLLKKRGGVLTPTKAGLTFLNHPDPLPRTADNIRRGFEGLMGEDTWRSIVEWLVGGKPSSPEIESWLLWPEAFDILHETAPNQVICTEQGSLLLEMHYDHYAGGRGL